MKKIIVCALVASALCAVPVFAAPAPGPSDPASPSSPSLDLQRWLQDRWEELRNPFRGSGTKPRPADSVTDPTCDPSRTKCPIG